MRLSSKTGRLPGVNSSDKLHISLYKMLSLLKTKLTTTTITKKQPNKQINQKEKKKRKRKRKAITTANKLQNFSG